MKLRPALVIALAALFAAGPALAQKRGNDQRNDRNGSALPESVRKVERETGGDVLRAESRTRDGEEVTRVKVITPQGRVRTVESRRPPEREKDDDGDPSSND